MIDMMLGVMVLGAIAFFGAVLTGLAVLAVALDLRAGRQAQKCNSKAAKEEVERRL